MSPSGAALGPLPPLGRMALTQYLMQSVVCTQVFNGYGLGLYGKVSVAAFLLGGLAIFPPGPGPGARRGRTGGRAGLTTFNACPGRGPS